MQRCALTISCKLEIMVRPELLYTTNGNECPSAKCKLHSVPQMFEMNEKYGCSHIRFALFLERMCVHIYDGVVRVYTLHDISSIWRKRSDEASTQ